MAGGAAAAAGGLLWLEFCIPSLLLCWFCCWNDDCSESADTEGRPPSIPIVTTDELRHAHAPRTTGYCGAGGGSILKITYSTASHSSHEEPMGGASWAGAGGSGEAGGPVLSEVLHRRDWDTQLHNRDADYVIIRLTDSPCPPIDLEPVRTCKKHHTNIKSSKKNLTKEDSRHQDPKDFEEPPPYIDDNVEHPAINENLNIKRDIMEDEVSLEIDNDILINRQTNKAHFIPKEAKQNYNESVKNRNSLKIKRTSEVYDNDPVSKASEDIEQSLRRESSVMNVGADESGDVEVMSMRSGAIHHLSKDSLETLHSRIDPRASVEAVSYSVAACYLQSPPRAGRAGGGEAAGGGRGRLASDGDILETSHRPNSTAFSENDVEFELKISASIEKPPPYSHAKDRDATTLTHTTTRRKETAL